MFVSHQTSTVKHLWVDLHDEVDRFVFWQYICHLRFVCQEVRCALGSIRWLISVLWDTLPCLLYFKWQKKPLFLALPAGIHTPLWLFIFSYRHKIRKNLQYVHREKRVGAQHHVKEKLSSSAPSHLRHRSALLRVQVPSWHVKYRTGIHI